MVYLPDFTLSFKLIKRGAFMSENKFVLTTADENAISVRDSDFLLNKGADLYAKGDYRTATEYYRLAAVMGDDQAIANLGYVYLYGRAVEPNLSIAMGYFKIAAGRNNIDGAYKLGDIYGSDKWCVKDTEMSLYYYRMAAALLIDGQCDPNNVIECDCLKEYPSLCFALGREMSVQGHVATNLSLSYQFLKLAEAGYKIALLSGIDFYGDCLSAVKELLNDSQYDLIRDKYDNAFSADGRKDGFAAESDCTGKIMPS